MVREIRKAEIKGEVYCLRYDGKVKAVIGI
jgi:hypothetical protein